MTGVPADDATTKAFAYAVQNEKRIRALLRKSAGGDEGLASEMFSDVALVRLPRLFELYDGVRPVDNYMLNNLKWYAFKYVNAHKKSVSLEHDITYRPSESNLDALDKLNELDRYLITANVIYEMTYREIAIQLQWTIGRVSRSVKEAKKRLHDIYTVDEDWRFVKKVLEIICDKVD